MAERGPCAALDHTRRDAEPDEVRGEAGGVLPQLARRAPDSLPIRGEEAPLAGDVVLPVLDLHVEAAVDLQDERATVRQPPLRVGVAQASVAAPPACLPGGRGQAEGAAQTGEVDLREGTGAARDLLEARPQQRGLVERLHPADPLLQGGRGREALLHDGGHHALRSPGRALVGSEVQHGGLELHRRQRQGATHRGKVATRAAVDDALDRLVQDEVLRDEDRHLIAVPPLESVHLGGRQVGEECAGPCVQDTQPSHLRPGRCSSGRREHHRGARDPAFGVELGPHPVPVHAQRCELPATDQALLGARDLVPTGCGALERHPSSMGSEEICCCALSTAPPRVAQRGPWPALNHTRRLRLAA